MTADDTCGYEGTEADHACRNPATYPDGRCGKHTTEKGAETNLSREDKVGMRIAESAHGRLKGHVRDGETMSGAIHRALDALELIDDLPDAVARELEGESDG